MDERTAQKRYDVAWDEFIKSFRRLRKMVLADGGEITMDVKMKAAPSKKRRGNSAGDVE
jgi:hypothetical protein